MPRLLAKLLNYMRQQDAIAQGFTHHGDMYGVPCWVGYAGADGPMVAAKWGPLEHFISLGHWFMGLHCAMTDKPPVFRIGIGDPIRTD